MYRALLHLMDLTKENFTLCGAEDARATDDLDTFDCLNCLEAAKLRVEFADDLEDWQDTLEAQRSRVIKQNETGPTII